jgi:hypothetical protein
MNMAITTNQPYSSQTVPGKVRMGSIVKKDMGPGAFFTQGTMKDMMLEQRRAFIGGQRTYGDEYDNYYQDRRWQTPSGSAEPTFVPTTTRQKLQQIAKKAIDQAVAEGAEEAIDGLGSVDLGRIRRRAQRLARALLKKRRRPWKLRKTGRRRRKGKKLVFKKKGLRGLGQLTADEVETMPEVAGLGEPVHQFLSEEDFAMVRCSPREQLYGLGQAEEAFNPVTAIRDIWEYTKDIKDSVEPVSPWFEFIGNHPIGSTALLILTLGAMGAVGSFVGGGGVDLLRTYLKKMGWL